MKSITALHFFYMVMVILGRFGVIQYRSRYVFMVRERLDFYFRGKKHVVVVFLLTIIVLVDLCSQYLLWTLLWVGWNVFVSCLYLDLGGLSKISHISVIIRDPHSVRSQIQCWAYLLSFWLTGAAVTTLSSHFVPVDTSCLCILCFGNNINTFFGLILVIETVISIVILAVVSAVVLEITIMNWLVYTNVFIIFAGFGSRNMR